MPRTDMNDPFDTPRDTDRPERRAARTRGRGRCSAEELLGQPTLRPTHRLDDPADSDAPLLVDAVTAARLLGIGRTTLDALTRKGEIPCVRLASRVLFPTAALHRIANGEGGAN